MNYSTERTVDPEQLASMRCTTVDCLRHAVVMVDKKPYCRGCDPKREAIKRAEIERQLKAIREELS